MKISSSSKRVQILKVIWRRNEVNVDFVRHWTLREINCKFAKKAVLVKAEKEYWLFTVLRGYGFKYSNFPGQGIMLF
jgi:hypothetical protein